MLKVFLVEDEIVMREGIKKNIDWEKEGFSFTGEASDGELAFPMIQKLHPDILITDIRMPFMDGLELAKHIHVPRTRIERLVEQLFVAERWAARTALLSRNNSRACLRIHLPRPFNCRSA